jgi:hypothetical protein
VFSFRDLSEEGEKCARSARLRRGSSSGTEEVRFALNRVLVKKRTLGSQSHRLIHKLLVTTSPIIDIFSVKYLRATVLGVPLQRL